MNKKKIILVTIIVVLIIISSLWITGIIPKFIAKVSATNYLKSHFPKKQFEFIDVEWSSSFVGHSIRFKDEKNEIVGFIMNNKYFPIDVGQGIFALEEKYREEFEKEKNDLPTNTDLVTNEINLDEITTKGVDEQKLFENVNNDDLEKIATLLQNLTSEIAEKEREDYRFAFEAKWYNYTIESEQFNQVLNMGNKALKPLYLIIYKSSNQGLYEYICCMAIQRITNYQIENWNNSKDFLEKFNKFICNNKEI